MVVIHHDAAKAPTPRAHGCNHLFRKCHGKWTHCLDRKPAGEIAARVCLVKLLAQSVRRRCLIEANELFEPASHDIAGLGHEVLAERPAGIRETVLMARAGGIKEQTWRLNRVARDDDGPRSLKMFVAVAIEIDNTVNAAVLAQTNARGHRMSANLCTVGDGIGHVGDESACFGADLAALEAKPAIDAVRPIPMRSGKDCDRPPGYRSKAELSATEHQHIAYAAQRMRSVGMAMRIAPREPGWPGNWNLPLQQFVVRLQIPIGQWPVNADGIF